MKRKHWFFFILITGLIVGAIIVVENKQNTTPTTAPQIIETSTGTLDKEISSETEVVTPSDTPETEVVTPSDASETEVAAPSDTSETEIVMPSDTPETEVAAPSSNAGLSVNGTKLVDANGNTVQLKGLSTHGIGWFPQYVNAALLKQLKNDFGINVIRLAMYTAESMGYCTDGDKDSLKKTIENGVSYATQNDMYSIIDWHILSDGNPNIYLEESKQFFGEMSKKYADNDHVLYEICNEPNGGTSWSDIKSYANQIIPIIRENAPNAIIIIGTPTWSQEVDKAAADPITGYDNLMYSLHFYAATHKDDLRKRMVAAINNGLPIFVTEFGICDASGNGGIDENQANEWIKTMNAYVVSYVMWNISNKNETSAIIRSDCSKSSNLAESDFSNSGKWFLNMMNGSISTKSPVSLPESNSLTNSCELEAQAILSNSWESDHHKFEQYSIIIKNNSGSDCSSWTASVDLKKNFTISQGWCANFETNGSILNISPLDYNAAIPSGQQIENIGLIIME